MLVSAVRHAGAWLRYTPTAYVWESGNMEKAKRHRQSVGLATFTRVYWKEEDYSFGRKEVPVLLVINESKIVDKY